MTSRVFTFIIIIMTIEKDNFKVRNDTFFLVNLVTKDDKPLKWKYKRRINFQG